MFRASGLACLLLLMTLRFGLAADGWAESAGNSVHNLSDTACDVMTSALTKWFVKAEGYSYGGSSAAGKLYVTMPKSRIDEIVKGQKAGVLVIEQHALSNADGATLAKNYAEVSTSSVPYFLQFGSIPFPNAVGGLVTLFDWALHLNTAQRATGGDLATLMPSGGVLSKSLAITAADAPHRWLLQQITFETTVNSQKRSYIVCSWAYPLKE